MLSTKPITMSSPEDLAKVPPSALKAVPDGHVHRVCLIGHGSACCRYLVLGSKGFECAKLSSLRQVLDTKADAGSILAVGDNCDGNKDIPAWKGDA